MTYPINQYRKCEQEINAQDVNTLPINHTKIYELLKGGTSANLRNRDGSREFIAYQKKKRRKKKTGSTQAERVSLYFIYNIQRLITF